MDDPSTHLRAKREADHSVDLDARLGGVAERAESPLRLNRVAARAAEFIEHGLLILCCVPAIVWLVLVSQRLFGLEPVTVSGWTVALAAILPAVWYSLIRGALVYFQPIDRRVALSLADEQLHLQDRLTTADEFIHRDDRSPFMQAAIEDAEPHLRTALDAEIDRPGTRSAALRPRGWAFASIAILAFIGILALQVEPTTAEPRTAKRPPIRGTGTEPEPRDDDTNLTREIPVTPPAAVRKEAPLKGAPRRDSERYNSDRSDETKDVKGKTGTGQSAEAASSTGQSESQGVPSDEGKVSKGDPKKAKKPKKSKKKKKPKEPKEGERKKPPEEASGRTAGLGSGRGSNRNPTATPWSSKDRVENVDDESLEEEDEVDDESEESESRGGMQPTLRDRKPPVSRDLSPSFGNRPNPNAKERGGPSAQKKSRGTASLVLGVPIPDQVKGQPNPGRTKITQEQIEPRSEESTPVVATPRTPRSDAIGPWDRMSLRPWMRDLVKSYFLNLRSTEETPR